MRVSTGLWPAIAVASVAGCLQQPESYPLYTTPPPSGSDAGYTGSSSSGGPHDAGVPDACAETVSTCSPPGDAGPDETCPPTGTVTGTIKSESTGCTADLLSVGGLATDAGCCSSACLSTCKL